MHNIDYEKLIPRLKDYLKNRYPNDTIYITVDDSIILKRSYDLDEHVGNNISQEIYQAGGGYASGMEVREIFQVIMDISQDDKGFVRILEEVRDYYFGVAVGQIVRSNPINVQFPNSGLPF